jgi:hypothetical protein
MRRWLNIYIWWLWREWFMLTCTRNESDFVLQTESLKDWWLFQDDIQCHNIQKIEFKMCLLLWMIQRGMSSINERTNVDSADSLTYNRKMESSHFIWSNKWMNALNCLLVSIIVQNLYVFSFVSLFTLSLFVIVISRPLSSVSFEC